MEGQGSKAGPQFWPKPKKACHFQDAVKHQNIWLLPRREPGKTGTRGGPASPAAAHEKRTAAVQVTASKTSKQAAPESPNLTAPLL